MGDSEYKEYQTRSRFSRPFYDSEGSTHMQISKINTRDICQVLLQRCEWCFCGMLWECLPDMNSGGVYHEGKLELVSGGPGTTAVTTTTYFPRS